MQSAHEEGTREENTLAAAFGMVVMVAVIAAGCGGTQSSSGTSTAAAAVTSIRGHLYELDGDLPAAGAAYADAARRATDVAERDHLVRQAARVRAGGTVAPLRSSA